MSGVKVDPGVFWLLLFFFWLCCRKIRTRNEAEHGWRWLLLGDGLFASFDGWQIVLYTTDGIRTTNQVYLEPEVLAAFLRYIELLKKQQLKMFECIG